MIITSTMTNLKVPTRPRQRPRQSPLGRVSKISMMSPRSNLKQDGEDQDEDESKWEEAGELDHMGSYLHLYLRLYFVFLFAIVEPERGPIIWVGCEVLGGNRSSKHRTLREDLI